MVGVPLTEGKHLVEYTYRNKAFDLGWKISLACAAVLGIVVLFGLVLESEHLFGLAGDDDFMVHRVDVVIAIDVEVGGLGELERGREEVMVDGSCTGGSYQYEGQPES